MDPHGSALIIPPGSRFGSRRDKFSIKKQKKCKEIGNNCKFTLFLKVNLHKLHFFLLLSYLFCFLQLKETLHKVFFFFKLDPDPQTEKLLDPDPQKMIADPQPCLLEMHNK